MSRLNDPVEYDREITLPRRRQPTRFDEWGFGDVEISAHFTVGPRVSCVEGEAAVSSRTVVVPHAKQDLEDFAEECLERWWQYVAHERICVTVPPKRSDTTDRDSIGYFTVVEWRGFGRRVRE